MNGNDTEKNKYGRKNKKSETHAHIFGVETGVLVEWISNCFNEGKIPASPRFFHHH